ncbi:S1 family peptidase [Segniliparus rugosus]|uniref:Peptidase S1 domain-containing protein n=1 Tax=Segniliparus rugosus (strain ATCC BAA-974 / DSM 45345 / CCUG 50838 / CIP 108380 / JCM 13579 / CDC 945) TaxID=679197 RepID=E5XRM6_SEGRC|nr:trypsin-like serine protease [Segniliparus rugosus]EFV12989.1 hypothetical protein HMPREF9336_02148 [Segniliparus rugosus ATCC BAA-974]
MHRTAPIVRMLAYSMALALAVVFSNHSRAVAMSNGAVVSDPDEAPWVVALTIPTKEGIPSTDRLKCGGVLIAPDKVLTAAHCAVAPDSFSVDPAVSPRPMSARSVEVLRANRGLNAPNTVARRVVSVFVDPDFRLLASPIEPLDPSRAAARHDLAVLVLDRPFGDPKAVIPLTAALPDPGARARVYGHGLTPTGDISDDLLRGGLTLISNQDCDAQTFVDVKYIGAVCAQTTVLPELSVQVGFGDSGGPLVVKGPGGEDVLVGVVSFGTETTGRVFSFGFNAFADVAAARGFIEEHAPDAVWSD